MNFIRFCSIEDLLWSREAKKTYQKKHKEERIKIKQRAIASVKKHFIDENEIQANVITRTICLICCSTQYFDSSTAA